jgi:hypothetical protein
MYAWYSDRNRESTGRQAETEMKIEGDVESESEPERER